MKDVILFKEKVNLEDLKADKYLPTDVHYVRYRKPTWTKKEIVSAFRAYRKVDIFNHLHDQGYVILEITSGFGSIRPNLYTK